MKAVRIGFKMIEGIQYTLISCKIKKERKHQERTVLLVCTCLELDINS